MDFWQNFKSSNKYFINVGNMDQEASSKLYNWSHSEKVVT